jgi:hypothetical protein
VTPKPSGTNNYNTINHKSNGLIEKTGIRTNRPDFPPMKSAHA